MWSASRDKSFIKMFEERYWTEEWIATLCEQSKNYAHQKGIPCTEINAENMKVFLAILILSGYNKVPNRRLYWSESPDTQNKLVIDSMRRDTFEQIMRCLHFNEIWLWMVIVSSRYDLFLNT